MDGWLAGWFLCREDEYNGAVRVTEKTVWDARVFVHIRTTRRNARDRCDVSTLSGIVASEGRSGAPTGVTKLLLLVKRRRGEVIGNADDEIVVRRRRRLVVRTVFVGKVNLVER